MTLGSIDMDNLLGRISEDPQADNGLREDAAEEFKLLFNIPIGLSSRFAHHMMVQFTDHEMTLSFFELLPPVGTTDEQIERARTSGVRADCVSRVTVPRDRQADFVKALSFGLGEEKSGK
ncbi:MAG TPA: hypothetical protein VGN86_16020 [Pyrinomonadaceae bacterium]|jgi:hypothetical protein|nr:hypothetical protein [Pyrinomonadaceae bacterium]